MVERIRERKGGEGRNFFKREKRERERRIIKREREIRK